MAHSEPRIEAGPIHPSDTASGQVCVGERPRRFARTKPEIPHVELKLIERELQGGEIRVLDLRLIVATVDVREFNGLLQREVWNRRHHFPRRRRRRATHPFRRCRADRRQSVRQSVVHIGRGRSKPEVRQPGWIFDRHRFAELVPTLVAAHPMHRVHVLIRRRIVGRKRGAVGIEWVVKPAARINIHRGPRQTPTRVHLFLLEQVVRVEVGLRTPEWARTSASQQRSHDGEHDEPDAVARRLHLDSSFTN